MQNPPDPLSEVAQAAEESETKSWLTTYADMVTLLLTFFVMLLAISTLDTERFENIVNSIQYTLGASVAAGGRTGRIDMHEVQKRSLSQVTGVEDEPLLKDIRQMVKMKNLDDVISVAPLDGKLVVRVKGQVLFPAGSARLSEKAGPVLDAIAKLAKQYPEYRVDVGGHTDPRPVKKGRFQDNWELSALRATAVLKRLIRRGVPPRRLTATGYADTDPLAPNTSAANMARNRRVEFVLEKIER